jgi:hypothetical protein
VRQISQNIKKNFNFSKESFKISQLKSGKYSIPTITPSIGQEIV